MIDVFNEQIEVLIKEGISNLYWFKGDLKKSFYRANVPENITHKIFGIKYNGKTLTKREMLDKLYENIRNQEYNRRLEISRNFVRILIEHKNFVPQDNNHRIEKAERVALKLREIVNEQKKQEEYRDKIKTKAKKANTRNFEDELMNLREKFLEVEKITNKQKRGIEFEKFFTDLMKANQIPVEVPFRIVGEQIDGAIKYDGHYYLLELKWQKTKSNQAEIASLFMKVEGKLDARGIFIAMEGFSSECLESLPKGKNLKVLLLDGVHLTSVIFGNYTFSELMEHSISQASLKGEIYCNHNIVK
ncbi:restriction endonuclease [Postechiella marina]|uniref:Restriction endonuclease n=1 Tax=Postechiella marina TaxID=943941 RepID=A0ABP8CJ23_9FLAO